jgi:xanthine dehydrogenase accessory factor
MAKRRLGTHSCTMTRAPHDLIPEAALAWHSAGLGAALATVVETWGSAPRQAGSQLAISGTAEMIGSVSGGCVEGAVVAEGLAALQDGKSRILTFGVSDDDAFAVGLACGGTIRVLVEPVGSGTEALPASLLADMVAARAVPRALAVETQVDGWVRRLVFPGTDAAVDARLKSDRSGMEEDGRFIAVHNPPLRLIVIGAVHIAQPLLTIARECGYAATLIDPRSAFGSAARFPGETILNDWPDDALSTLAPDTRTAIVTLTHDPKLDDPAIRFAIRSQAFYLGCLGSKRTHAKRVERLSDAGFSPDDIARIHAPVGLDIGAKSPAEIAVSIMAQITQSLRK